MVPNPSIATEITATEQILLVRRGLARSPSDRYDPDTGEFDRAVIEQTNPYTHPSGLFSLDIPQNWELTDRSQPGEVVLLWFDPTENASIWVNIFDAPPEELPMGLEEVLQFFLQRTFGDRPNFAMERPVVGDDGSARVTWGYTKMGEDASGWWQANSFIERQGDKIAILHVFTVGSQFSELAPQMTQMVNSYRIDPSVSTP